MVFSHMGKLRQKSTSTLANVQPVSGRTEIYMLQLGTEWGSDMTKFKVTGMASVVSVDQRRNGEGRAGRRMSKYTCDEYLKHSRNKDYIGQKWLVSSHSLCSLSCCLSF